MLRDITVGQYYPAKSLIHKLDPRVKMVAVLVYMVSLFLFDGVIGLLLATAFLGAAIYLSKVSLRYMMRGMRPILVLLLITFVFNLVFTRGESIFYWRVYGDIALDITLEGIRRSVILSARLIYVVLGASLLTFTTTPERLSSGMERAFSFLKRVNIPVHGIALTLTLALRFIPVMIEEANRIIKVQSARGADFGQGKMMSRIKNTISIIVPLLTVSIKRSNELAYAMEARCYHEGARRTNYRRLKMYRRDYVALAVTAVYLIVMILI